MSIKNLGVLVKSLKPSQQNLVIFKGLNQIAEQYANVSLHLFHHEYGMLLQVPRFSIIQSREAWFFDGPLVTTNIEMANLLSNCLTSTQKYFYVWDIEWFYMMDLNYIKLQNVYQNDKIELIARCKDHAEIIEECWKKPKYIIEDFKDIVKIIE